MLGRGNHAEVEELRAELASFRAAHAVEEKLRHELAMERDAACARAEAADMEQIKANEVFVEVNANLSIERLRVTKFTGYVRRLREALIAHTPPMFMREVEALLQETNDGN